MLKTPFPTVFEGLRLLFKALGIKAGNKVIDDEARNVWADYRYLDELIEGFFGERLQCYISTEAGVLYQLELRKFIDSYLQLVATHSADGLTREEIIGPLIKFWIAPRLLSVVSPILINVGWISVIDLFSSQKSSVFIVLNWLNDNSSEWVRYKKQCEKGQKDRVSAWHRGEDLPSAQYISLLNQYDANNDVIEADWQKVKTLLFIARAIEAIKKESFGLLLIDTLKDLSFQSPPIDNQFSLALKDLRNTSVLEITSIKNAMVKIDNDMLRGTEKSEASKDELRLKIDCLYSALKEQGSYDSSSVFVCWMDARWHVFSGDLEKASELYKKAAELSLYRSGEKLSSIVREALVVAASTINKLGMLSPDKAFLKQLKNIMLLFRLDAESVDQAQIAQRKNRYQDFVSAFEVGVWAGHFDSEFPLCGKFNVSDRKNRSERIGLWQIDKSISYKPNFERLNTKITNGVTWKQSLPQLIWFIFADDFNSVKELIERGANIDVESESGDTALTAALEKLVVLEVARPSMDESYLNLLLDHPDISKIINKQTQRMKFTPLIQAIETCRSDIVQRILWLGADPDMKGSCENYTPLNVCIATYDTYRNPQRILDGIKNSKITEENLDSMRRETYGQYGHMLSDQLHAFRLRDGSKEEMKVFDLFAEKYIKNMRESIDLEELNETFKIILQGGADPNFEVGTPKGYTALMLAVQFDFDKEVAVMLAHGGDLNKAYRHPNTGVLIDSWAIAEISKSKKVLRLMEDVKPIYQNFCNV